MIDLHPKYITDKKGKKLSVIISIQEFEQLVEELEEQEDIRLYDEAKAANEDSVLLDEAFELIEKSRNK